MALLTLNERKAIFRELGLGEYNEANIKAFQKKYMLRKSDADGKYGKNTDNTLRTVYYTKVYTKSFKPSEFVCECGGKYCCGYPSYMKPAELIHIQAIRDHYGKPVTITSGLRCRTWNSKCGGSIQNSLHMSGQALDFYQPGVTDTLGNRKASIKWIKKRPNHHYTYGNGINSYGNGISAPYMGNALHTDCYDNVAPKHPSGSVAPTPAPTPKPAPAPKPTTKARLTVDGIGGKDTVKAMQDFFGVKASGVLGGQNKSESKHYPSLTAVRYGSGGSPCVRKLQKWCGSTIDGVIGEHTVKRWQRKIGVKADGVFGTESMKIWQKYLNEHLASKGTNTQEAIKKPSADATQSSATIVDKELKACEAQAEWMKNYKYKWQNNPTIPKSKKYGTCVTYVACVLQRIGILKSGQYIWIDERGKVFGTNSKMKLTYLKGTLKSNKAKLKKGDIIIGGNGNVHAAGGSHIFILTGKWDKNDNPYIWDQASAERVKAGKKGIHTWKGSFKVIALIRLK